MLELILFIVLIILIVMICSKNNEPFTQYLYNTKLKKK